MFESESEIGGRLVSWRHPSGLVFDMGATGIAPRGRQLELDLLAGVGGPDLVRISKEIYTHAGLRVSPGDANKNAVARYTFPNGNQTLVENLAQGLDVRLSHPVGWIGRTPSGYEVLQESFDAVVLAVPMPVAAALLATLGDSRPLGGAIYRSCLSVALGYRIPTPKLLWFALIEPQQRHPLTWLSVESAKAPGRAPDGWTAIVAQMSPQFSRDRFESPDEEIVQQAARHVGRLFGPGWDAPEVWKVVRWPMSRPEQTLDFDTVNEPGSKLLVAGDGVAGSRVEYAYEAGLRAARRLM